MCKITSILKTCKEQCQFHRNKQHELMTDHEKICHSITCHHKMIAFSFVAEKSPQLKSAT